MSTEISPAKVRELAERTSHQIGVPVGQLEELLSRIVKFPWSWEQESQQTATTPGGMSYSLPPGWPNPTRRDHA